MRCEAVLLLAPELPPADLAALAARAPVVVVARHAVPDGFDVVRVADEAGVGEAVDHLVGLGHRRIVHVDGGEAAMAADRRGGVPPPPPPPRLRPRPPPP